MKNAKQKCINNNRTGASAKKSKTKRNVRHAAYNASRIVCIGGAAQQHLYREIINAILIFILYWVLIFDLANVQIAIDSIDFDAYL